MELSEVVSAHFAFPIVGVVLCAVLVFAFGFKSPVQPPSFDLLDDDDDRKYKKFRQKKLKSSIDGHVINIDSRGSPGAKVKVVKQQITLPNEKAEQQLVKTKIKKPKTVAEIGLASDNQAEEDNTEGPGEWTKALSKKDRKNRSKKDDGPKKELMTTKTEIISSTNETQMVTCPIISVKDVKNKEEVSTRRSYRKNMEVTVTAPAPAPTLVVCSAVLTDSETASANSFASRAKATIRVSVPSTPHVELQKPVATCLEQSDKPTNSSSIPKLSEPLKEKEENLSDAASPNLVRPTDEGAVQVLPSTTVVTTVGKVSTDGDNVKAVQDSISIVAAGDSKPARSPKKKKSPETREKYKESPVVALTEAAPVSAESTTETKEMINHEKYNNMTDGIQKGRSSDEDENKSENCIQLQKSSVPLTQRTVEVTVPTAADCQLLSKSIDPSDIDVDDHPVHDALPPADSEPAIDDWQQAKPLKKKRRLPKDN